MAKKIIYTLNARSHEMLESMRNYFKIGPARMQHEIQGLLAQTKEILASKGIKYSALKSALVPDPKRREIALVFDTLNMQESWYGFPIYRALMPLLSRQSNYSILAGDYIGDNDWQDVLYERRSE
ncbi:MAG: hypothetical protein J4F42_12610 [Desulfurellaceae bacterium]|nr:hypothetical protein [Desulfurellaceae bacterium]